MSDEHVTPPPVPDSLVAGALGALRESVEDLRKRPVALDPDALKSVIRAALAEATAPPPNLLVTAIRRLELVERRLESLEQAVRAGGGPVLRPNPVVGEPPAPIVLPAPDAEAVADALARRLAASAPMPAMEGMSFATPVPGLDTEAVALRVADLVSERIQATTTSAPSAPPPVPTSIPVAIPAPVVPAFPVEELTERLASVVMDVLQQHQPAATADAASATNSAITAALVPVAEVLARLETAIEEATTPVEVVGAVSRLESGVSALAEALEDDREHQAKLLASGLDEVGERVEKLWVTIEATAAEASADEQERIAHIAEAVLETRNGIQQLSARLEEASPTADGQADEEVLGILELLKSQIEELSSRPSMLGEVDALRGEIESMRALVTSRAESQATSALLDDAMTTLEQRLAERFDTTAAEQLASIASTVDSLDVRDEMKELATSLARLASTAQDLSGHVAQARERIDANAASIELSRRAADAGEGARSAVHGMRNDLTSQLSTWSATLEQAAARLAALIESSTEVLAERLDSINTPNR